jgi:hypothetical protein
MQATLIVGANRIFSSIFSETFRYIKNNLANLTDKSHEYFRLVVSIKARDKSYHLFVRV